MAHHTPVIADIGNTAPCLPSLPTAATLMVYSLFEVNPMMIAVVPCTSGKTSGKTVTKYENMIFASPFKNGSSQLILIDDSVTLSMLGERGLSKTVRKQIY